MTPLEMSILIHYHCSRSDFRDGDFSAPAVRLAIDGFKDSGFIRLTDKNDHPGPAYVATEKCTAYVTALEAVPEPVQRWVIPTTQGAKTL